MIKIVKIISFTLLSLMIIAAVFVFSKIENRPAKTPNVQSITYSEDYQSAALNADAWLKVLYEKNQLPSVSAAVGINGQVLWSGAIGYANLNKNILADSNSPYRIGSISKSLTAVAVMRMNEKSIINIDAPFNTYVHDAGFEKTSYTIKQLLSHQAGIRHYNKSFTDNFNTKEYSSNKETADIVKNDPLLFVPGTGFKYSTYGYTLLSLAMESAYSMPYENILTKEVISPLGLKNTYLNKAHQPKEKNLTAPYWLINNNLFEAPEENVSHKYAGAGYISTPTDLVKFGSALLKNEFLTSESKEKLWSPVALKNGAMNPENYALGFRIGEDESGKFVHHGGTTNGGYAFLLIYPDSGVVVAITSNFTSTNLSFDRLQEAKKLARIFKQ